MKTIYASLKQNATALPVVVDQSGDVSDQFTLQSQDPVRISAGVYQHFTGDDLFNPATPPGDHWAGNVQATLGVFAGAFRIVASITDANQLTVRTFDQSGNPTDVEGDYNLTIHTPN